MLGRLLSLLVTAAVFAVHAAPLQWEWITPTPHRQSWGDFAAGNGHVVGLTDGYGGRSIYTWVNCSNWVAATSPTNITFQDVIFTEGQFIAVANNATVATSKDGVDWKLRHTDAAGASFVQIAAGGGTYVTLAGGPRLAYSKDLMNWKIVQPDTGFTFTALAYGNGKFVAVGPSKLFTSTDGAVWTNIPWPNGVQGPGWSATESGLVFRNGVFLMASETGSAISVDGEQWTATSAQPLDNVVATETGYIGLRYQTVYFSPTGASWSPILELDPTLRSNVRCAIFTGREMVIGGEKGVLYTSADMVNWRRWVKPADYNDSQIVFGRGTYLRYGGTNGVCISSNGSDWQRIVAAPGLKAAVFGNGIWVGFDHSGNAVISENGKSWESVPLPVAGKDRILFADGRFVGEADGGLLTSVDGQVWQLIPFETAQRVRIIGRANGIWCASVDGSPATSNDGISWATHAGPEIGATVYAAGNGRFIAMRGAGMGPGFVKWSTNGVDWQSQPISATTYVEDSLSFVGGQFILTDQVGGIYQSADGLNWSGGRQAPQGFRSVAYGNGEFLVCGGDAILRSSARALSAAVFKLQLVQQGFNNWTLSVAGSAGQVLEIEASADLNEGWTRYQTITIPQTGSAQIPADLNSGDRFFRAKTVGF